MLEISEINKDSIETVLENIEKEQEINCSLPGGGLLHIEKELPYLIIYRHKENDPGTARLVISESSYLIIGNREFENYQNLLFAISDKLSATFKSYMLFEVFSGKVDSTTFYIKGPEDKLPNTLQKLNDELNAINKEYSGIYLKAEIQNTPHRQPEGEPDLLSVTELKKCGALITGLEVPPIYRNDNGELYPVFFRNFKDFIIKAIHKSIFEYIRIQTSGGVASYNALGRKYLKQKVFEIDKKLASVERAYQFLWLVSPSNIQEIKNTFFESNFDKVLDYHYRLLPIDPDVLKRKLYNLKIEDIDDPAMSFIFREKREELDKQITMLTERGSRNFFFSSIRLHRGVDNDLYEAAREILDHLQEKHSEEGNIIDSKGFSSLARREFDYFRSQDPHFKCKVHIRKDVNVMMVSHGELYIPHDYKMNETEAKALIQHEVGTHVLTYFNGSQQPLEQLSIGLADYDPLQEGLAVMAEYLVGGLTGNRLRTLAGRVIAGHALVQGGDFHSIFKLLNSEYGFSAERAFNIVSRIMQGGGFLKDIIYLKGLVELREYLQNGGLYEPLLAGKFSLKHTEIIEELTERRVLKSGALRPSYLSDENLTNRLNLIRDGLPISQMTTL
ncbi:flavohemoglobin expression-modulating QEGLA motif protein [Zunongwangia endophytica]|uniref:Flavohemoglobin expression-modulating QEGLA motif protein n=1 Tax=Zunongwangia endophytica TaxID=1808945 RepID=A0ABV8H5B4_9FLAO|nr:tyrosine/phenylalanine carboxypeptidase domain-containing protein [Zunongwangia endophytica]MDN3594466.1 DUF1704 domain-containing protein [Zunongwangia endophytica]